MEEKTKSQTSNAEHSSITLSCKKYVIFRCNFNIIKQILLVIQNR